MLIKIVKSAFDAIVLEKKKEGMPYAQFLCIVHFPFLI
jgi:hypothetical protein